MKSKKAYLIGVIVLVGLLIYLASNTFRTSIQYYLTVSELKAAENDYRDRVVKMAGKASQISRIESTGGLVYQFTVTEGSKEQRVIYKGIAPDTFKDGAEVVATGRLMSDGNFEATELLAKCASKYEAKIQ